MNDFKVLRTTVRDQAVDNLKQAILSGFLQPGQKLVEKDLCEMCGVSRTSIREALRILEGEKLIVHLPHRGLRVATPTVAEAQQIYEVRAVLEALLGRHAAQNAVRSDVVALHSSVDAFEKSVKAKDLRQMVSTADAFYAIFFKIAARPIISDMLQSLKDQSVPCARHRWHVRAGGPIPPAKCATLLAPWRTATPKQQRKRAYGTSVRLPMQPKSTWQNLPA